MSMHDVIRQWGERRRGYLPFAGERWSEVFVLVEALADEEITRAEFDDRLMVCGWVLRQRPIDLQQARQHPRYRPGFSLPRDPSL